MCMRRWEEEGLDEVVFSRLLLLSYYMIYISTSRYFWSDSYKNDWLIWLKRCSRCTFCVFKMKFLFRLTRFSETPQTRCQDPRTRGRQTVHTCSGHSNQVNAPLNKGILFCLLPAMVTFMRHNTQSSRKTTLIDAFINDQQHVFEEVVERRWS